MSSQYKPNVEDARRFLWDDDDYDAANNRSSSTSETNPSPFSTRNFAVDQSVNFRDNVGGVTPQAPEQNDRLGGIASSVAGLFRPNAAVETGSSTSHSFDEYGDATPSGESEEYISDKRRRATPLWSVIMNSINTCVNKCAILCGRLGPKGVGFVVLVFLILALVVGGISRLGKGGGSSSSSIVSAIVSAGMTPSEKFTSPEDNPQKAALTWILNEDPAQLSARSPGLLDRFALAVFYFSTNAEKGGWTQKKNWMSEKGICDWYGVQCVPREDTPTEENEYKNTKTRYDDNDSIIGIGLPNNAIEGSIPYEFGGLSNLITLDLQVNEIGGSIHESLSKATNLRNLLLRHNFLVGEFPTFLTKLTNLHELHLGENRFTGSIPTEISNLKELRSLALSGNLFTGKLPEMGELSKLIRLYLEENEFSGGIPDSFASFVDLRELRLSNNKFEGTISLVLENMKDLEVLRLNGNQLTGTIPNMFDKVHRISELQLQNNLLRGTLPFTLTHLRDLKKLFLDTNELTGNIPPNIGLLADVESISLFSNQMDGTIPSTIGILEDIVHLSLSRNQFSGPIPTELGYCFRLSTLQLDRNSLTSIPSELGNLDKLTYLQLENNAMTGISVPEDVCKLVKSDELAHLSADCKSKVNCSCCHTCL